MPGNGSADFFARLSKRKPEKQMKRIPEPELMDDPAQAHAYARADFNAPNSLFLQLFTEKFPHFSPLSVLDLGCGPADIAIRFARCFPEARVTGLDGASHMLDHGKRAIAACGFQKRVTLCKGVLPLTFLAAMEYEAIIANSLLHHLAIP
jgi:trans-aconitate methyltransferase